MTSRMKKTKSQTGAEKGRKFQDIIVPDYLIKIIGKNKYSKNIESGGYHLEGKSGFSRKVDMIVGKDKGFIEIKHVTSKKESTYKVHIDRSFIELFDLNKTYPSAKIFLIINKDSTNKKNSEKYRRLASLINLNFININSKSDRKLLKKELSKIIK